MSEEPHPKAASSNHDHKGNFAVGNTARPYSPTAVAREKASLESGDVGSTLRAAMLKALGDKKDLDKFLKSLRDKDSKLFAKILAQVEPKETRLEAERQIVFVDVCQGQPHVGWRLPDIGDDDATDKTTAGQSVAEPDAQALVGQGI